MLHCPGCFDKHICPAAEKPFWPHQLRGLREQEEAVRQGHSAIIVTVPTGGGKGLMQTEGMCRCVAAGRRALLLTNRKILTRQSVRNSRAHGVQFGVMAAGHDADVDLLARAQIASVPTLRARCLDRMTWQLPQADEVYIDEAHNRDFDPWIKWYLGHGAKVFGYTATPIGMPAEYTFLVQAGTNSELRQCGALVRCDVFAPTEPDMSGVRMTQVGEYVQAQAVKRVMQCICFGDVFDNWRRLNRWGLPTLLWAPGVSESRWFVENLERRGVTAAHIGDDTSDAEREDILGRSRDGELMVISSYGVLREGADLPWIAHGILVQPCGALKTYLQIVGRLLRAYPGKTLAVMQDHAGAWHKHGSPNDNRAWRLGLSEKLIAKELHRGRQKGELPEPIRCPKCEGIRRSGPECPHCHYKHKVSVRAVRMVSGELVQMRGPTVKRKKQKSPDQKQWDQLLWMASHRPAMTLTSLGALFKKSTGVWPARLGLKNCPPDGDSQWHLPAVQVFPWLARQRRGSTGSRNR